MATVSSQNWILVSPEYLTFVRGQAKTGTLTLHQNYVGNQVNIGTLVNLTLNIYDEDYVLVKTFSKNATTLSFGTGSTDSEGLINYNLTDLETAALKKGDVWAEVIIVNPINTYTLPKVRLGRTFDAGETLPGAGLAGRFTVPAPVFARRH